MSSGGNAPAFVVADMVDHIVAAQVLQKLGTLHHVGADHVVPHYLAAEIGTGLDHALDGFGMCPRHDDHMRCSRLGHHFGLQVAAIHGLEIGDNRGVGEGLSQGADPMQSFRQDQGSARFQPVDSGAHGQRGGFKSFVNVGEVERDLNNGFHEGVAEGLQINAKTGSFVTTKIMRNATPSPLRPRERPKRSVTEISRWRRLRQQWMATLEPALLFQRLFDHIPGVYFFAKNRDGRLMFASQGLLQRYDMRDDSEILGRTDFDLNPDTMAQAYVDDDDHILAGETALIERIELWWDSQGMPDWFLVTKLPLLDIKGRVQGVMGVLRRPDESERRLPVFQTVAKAVEIMRRDYAKALNVADVARSCGQSLRQLQRRFQTAFGITPQEFLIKTRVLASMRLLEESSLAMSEIAERCGFVDASSFTQHFRKRLRVAPATYRRQLLRVGT